MPARSSEPLGGSQRIAWPEESCREEELERVSRSSVCPSLPSDLQIAVPTSPDDPVTRIFISFSPVESSGSAEQANGTAVCRRRQANLGQFRNGHPGAGLARFQTLKNMLIFWGVTLFS